MTDNPALQHWDCDKCDQTHKTYLNLSSPPTHPCPSPKSRVRREFKLKAVKVTS